MTRSERIATLETLLARVRSRAGEPRGKRLPPMAVSPAVAATPATMPSEPPPSDEIDAVTIPSPPVPAPHPAPPPMRAALPTEADIVVEVEMLKETVGETVLGVTAEEVPPPGSRERLVAGEPAMGAVIELPVAESLGEAPLDLLAVVEKIEEAPESSRRPVVPEAGQRLADMAFGAEEESPPRHTPPPESGRLPASPSMDPDADVTGVREAPPMAPRTHDLVPEATRANLTLHDAVADMVGEVQRFAPSTFAALLDASLAL